jgi:hypothetical protein
MMISETRVSSALLYWENTLAFFSPKGVSVPVAVSVFPDGLYQTPRSVSREKSGRFLRWLGTR